MCRLALPEHLNDKDEIDKAFPDDSDNGSLWRWFKKTTKTWFVFGPRDPHWIERWREFPVCLFKIGQGMWRWENDKYDSYIELKNGYLSRVQYQMDWHIQLQWPLFFEVQIGTWEAYVGFKRDSDRVYWLAAYAGRIWK